MKVARPELTEGHMQAERRDQTERHDRTRKLEHVKAGRVIAWEAVLHRLT